MKAIFYSMTGFAEHTATIDGTSYFCRIRSVNHRFLDLKIRLPRQDTPALESEIRTLLQKSFGRGALELFIGYSSRASKQQAQQAPVVNTKLIEQYVKSAKNAVKKLGSAQLDLATLLRLPGVITEAQTSPEDTLAAKDVLQKLVQPAIKKLQDARLNEGKNTVIHMQGLMRDIRREFEAINSCSTEEREKLAGALESRIKETRDLLGANQKSPDFDLRMRQEAAFWLDRRDIEEEQVRFRSHLEEFDKVFTSAKEPSGKKLDFLHQEISREINTLGNKAQSSKISKHVVEIKTLLEKFKEQVANVE